MKLRIQVEGRAYEVDVDHLDANGALPLRRAAEAQVPESVIRPRATQKLPEDSVCRSPIAGRVVAVVGAQGKKVRRNEPVVVLDAMKMEVPIGPAVDGTIKAVHVEVGDVISARQVLFELS
jgi:biotin carboxyl carrier protein